jgi:glycosyltransferase involved in cell wall biosynthesis
MSEYNFSILIPTFQRQCSLQTLLDSICKQSLPTREWEVIVIDDQSGEDFTEILQKYSNRINISVIASNVKGDREQETQGHKMPQVNILFF